MDPAVVMFLAFAGIIAAVVVLTVLGSALQRRRRASKPARHEGERQAQRGRVFKYGTNHSNTPDSW